VETTASSTNSFSAQAEAALPRLSRTTIVSERAQVKRLVLGYSDDVSVFLNGKILYRGRSAQWFRDPGFLGIVNPENDAESR
jgi:hypothetical protein